MKKTLTKHWITAGLMVVISLAATPGHAADDALRQLIEVLHDNGTINDEAYEKLRAAVSEGDTDPVAQAPDETEAVDQDAASQQTGGADQARVEFEGRKLRVESADERFGFRLGGRMMADIAYYDDDVNALGSGGELRRLRLSWDARLWRDWQLKAAVEFAGGVDIKSSYVDYLGFTDSYARFGFIKEPISMEELTSSKYTTFMERAMVTDLGPGRNIGFAGGITRGGWGLSGGVFAGGEEGEEEQDDGVGYTARLFYAPWRESNLATHLGASLSFRELGDSRAVRFRARPESHATDIRFVDTGSLTDVDDVTRVGLEAALVVDSLSLQAEYLTADLGRVGGAPDLRFSGWYAYASWFPTGESRNYKDGEFSRISPRRPFGQGGPGAFELGVRFSSLDLTDEEIIGGVEDNLTVGVNWYPISNVRFMANYIKVLDVDRPGSAFDGDEPSIFQIRGQADF